MRPLAIVFVSALATASLSVSQAATVHKRARPVCRRHSTTRARRAAKTVRRSACRRTVSHPGKAVRAVSGGLIVGLNANASGYGGASTANQLQTIISRTGAKWLRERLQWSIIEPSPGTFSFSYYDHFMLLAARRGERILAVLGDTPAWAGPSSTAIPADPSSYAAYVAAVVNRYGPHGSFWAAHPRLIGSAIPTFEFWNEPFFDSGDNGDYDPARYANLVKAAAIAGRAADPSAKFLIAAEMQSARDANGNWVWWVEALYRAVPNLGDYFDGVAMHDYGADTTTLNPIIFGQPYNNYGHILRIQNLRQQFVDHGAASKPFWITEAGWSTCTDSTDCVSNAQQAGNLTTLFGDIHGSWKSWVQAAFIYRYGDGANPTTMQDGYGLSNLDGSPKPALAVFQREAAASA
jgi:hypothetical protein